MNYYFFLNVQSKVKASRSRQKQIKRVVELMPYNEHRRPRIHFSYWERNIERSALKLRQQQGKKTQEQGMHFEFRDRLKSPIRFLIILRYDMTPRSLRRLCSEK